MTIKPEWRLSEQWAIARDPYNWILLKKACKSWKKSYYASAEQLLTALHRKFSRTGPAQPDLLKHLEACLEVAQAFSRRFYQLVGASAPVAGKNAPEHTDTMGRTR
jgi:hypothetical protein